MKARDLQQPKNILLGVNIDHVATLRQARGTVYPDLIESAIIAQKAGAHGITIHLREDRRHIQDNDLWQIRPVARFLNLEMALVPEIIEIALKLKPDICCLVPEKRQELTTEGGLDVLGQFAMVKATVKKLQSAGISVSLFIEADPQQIKASQETGATNIELHTGTYADAPSLALQEEELIRLQEASTLGQLLGLIVNAGHGLHYNNVKAIASIPEIHELNIGHSIIARAVFVGLENAVKEMIRAILEPQLTFSIP